jgi:hypothetical protein
MNDLREYEDTTWAATWSFPNKIIVYLKDSLKIVDETNTLLMEFQIGIANCLQSSRIKKIKFVNNELQVLDVNFLTIIDFKTNIIKRYGRTGHEQYDGNITHRNYGYGYKTLLQTNVFNSELIDYVRLEKRVGLSAYSDKMVVFSENDNVFFDEQSGAMSCIFAQDQFQNKVWVFDNVNSKLGYFTDIVNGNFYLSGLVPINITSMSVNAMLVDSSHIYIGHNLGILRYHKGSGNTESYSNFQTFNKQVSYNSIIDKLGNILVGTGTTNGCFVTIDKRDMNKKSLFSKNSIFDGNNYYGVG